MNPIHLRTFLAVEKERSYTRAAEALFLTQPAVSRQIDQLEKKLGLPLFEQIGKRLLLTDAGRTLAREAERLLGNMDRVAEAVRAHLSPGRGRIAVGASSTPGLYLLPAVIGQFCRRFPEVEFHYCIENSERVENLVVRNELDLGFVGVAPRHDMIVAEPLLKDRIVCFASASHPLAKRRRIDPKLLERETWILREKGAATRKLMETWLAKAGVEVGHTVELACPEGIKSLVAAGVGCSCLSIHGLADDANRRKYSILDIRGLRLNRSIFVIRHVDKHISPAMDALLRLAKTAFSETSADKIREREPR